jgi:hypothetical protein
MPLTCNIDRTGRRIRLIAGIVVEAAGAIVILLRAAGVLEGTWPWVVGLSAIIGGSFMIFEGVMSWCAVRALGFRTPV